MKTKSKLLLGLALAFALCLGAAACGPAFKAYEFENPPFLESDWRDLTTDSDVTLDGKAGEAFWASNNAFTYNGDKTPDASMSVKTHFGDKGMYFFLSVKDNAVYWNDERAVYENTSVELMIAPPGAEKLSINTVQARIGANGYTEQWMGRRSGGDYDFTRIYFPMMARVQVNGEMNSSKCEGFDVEVFIPWESIGLTEKPEYIQVMPAFNHVGGLGSTDGRAYNIPQGMGYNEPTTYYRFDNNGFADVDAFAKADIRLDGKLDEWFDDETAKYASVSLANAAGDGRGWESYAFLTENGLNIAAVAKHKTNPVGQQDWFNNVNFEVQIGTRQYWVTAAGHSAKIAAKLVTEDSKVEDSATRFTSTIEMFIPKEMFPAGMQGRSYVRAGWAFKSNPEEIELAPGRKDSWWFVAGHLPNSPADHFNIYDDGVYLTAKGAPTGGAVTGDGYKGYSDGWDLSKDTAETSEIRNTGVRNQNVYFKNVSGTKYYVEASFTMNARLENDDFPKFGLIAGENDANLAAFLVDPMKAMNNKWVLAVDRNEAGDWVWGPGMKEFPEMQYTNGAYVKLAVLRDGETFYFYVNDQLAGTKTFRGMGAGESSVPGIYAMNADITVKNMKAETDPAEIDKILAKSAKVAAAAGVESAEMTADVKRRAFGGF